MRLDHNYYLQEDICILARDLLGKYIFTKHEGNLTGGYITETEAYAGTIDKASHAWGGRRTARTEVLYREGGIAYVYMCYGIHFLFNVVSNIEDVPHAILIRGIHPVFGIETMLERAGKPILKPDLANGPGKVSKVLGISKKHNGENLRGKKVWLEDRGMVISQDQISITKRIGIDYAAEDAILPYRFVLK